MTLNATGLCIGVVPSAGKFEVLEGGTGSGTGGIYASTATAGGNPGYVFRTASTNRWAINLAGSAGVESLRFRDENASATRMTIDSSGNVGIGVTPSAWGSVFKALQIADTGAAFWSYRSGSTSDQYLYISNNSYATNANEIYVRTNAAAQYRQVNGTHAWLNAPSGTAGNAITFTQAMTLDASGNLLVGRTTLFAQPSRFTLESNSQTTAICGIFNDARTDSASAINIAFYRNGIKVGSVDCTDAATSYVTSSDYRLKEDVQPLSGGLARVSALKPSIYKWKINGSNGEGFIAHELAEVVPAAVTGEKDAVNKDGTVNPQGVDMSKVVPILVAAIQELTARVQTLEAK